MAIPDAPLTRGEQYLNRIATGSGTIPDEPLTRVEQYLDYIAENGGSGGGGGGFSGGGGPVLILNKLPESSDAAFRQGTPRIRPVRALRQI